MSLIPHGFLPRSMFDMDLWHKPAHHGQSTLDLFDPFDELDHMIGRNMMWLNKPDFLKDLIPTGPRVPEKYRISVDCKGYSAKSIKIEVSQDKEHIVVHGRENEKHDDDDYHMREFKKKYRVPKNAEIEKMVSFMTSHGHLIIEIPLKAEKDDVFPRVIDDENGQKHIEMNLSLPMHIDPSKVKVTCKDRDIIIQAEDKLERPDSISKIHYYRRTTLPENTDFNSMKCLMNENHLSVKAPLNMDFRHHHHRHIPIESNNEHKKHIAQN